MILLRSPDLKNQPLNKINFSQNICGFIKQRALYLHTDIGCLLCDLTKKKILIFVQYNLCILLESKIKKSENNSGLSIKED